MDMDMDEAQLEIGDLVLGSMCSSRIRPARTSSSITYLVVSLIPKNGVYDEYFYDEYFSSHWWYWLLAVFEYLHT
jgi:hypothetical protein